MDNQDNDDETTINVKNVRKSSWESAKRVAKQRGDNQGKCVSDLLDVAINLEKNGITAPSPPPAPLTPDQRIALFASAASLLQGLAAVKQATGKAHGRDIVMQMLHTLRADVGQAPGNPGKSRALFGKAVALIDEDNALTH